jgi:hypothetical protein
VAAARDEFVAVVPPDRRILLARVLYLCLNGGMAADLIIHERGKPIRVKDPETGERLLVERDDRYLKCEEEFWAAECKHTETKVMRVPVAGGSVQVRAVCTNCGERTGNALSQRDPEWVKSLPEFIGDLSESYQSRRSREHHARLLSLARLQHVERGKFTVYYQEYMKALEWYSKRDLVLKRCGGVCEGCGIASATEAHHTTYRHFGNEFLFELLGLCHDCHKRVHADSHVAEGGIEAFGPAAAGDDELRC